MAPITDRVFASVTKPYACQVISSRMELSDMPFYIERIRFRLQLHGNILS
jgi:hypothetical protein